MATTIHLSDKLKARLARHKLHPREPYADVVERALDVLEEEDLELSTEYQDKMKRGRDDVRAGRTLTTEELMKELGL